MALPSKISAVSKQKGIAKRVALPRRGSRPPYDLRSIRSISTVSQRQSRAGSPGIDTHSNVEPTSSPHGQGGASTVPQHLSVSGEASSTAQANAGPVDLPDNDPALPANNNNEYTSHHGPSFENTPAPDLDDDVFGSEGVREDDEFTLADYDDLPFFLRQLMSNAQQSLYPTPSSDGHERTFWHKRSVRVLLRGIATLNRFGGPKRLNYAALGMVLMMHPDVHPDDRDRIRNHPTAVRDKAVNLKVCVLRLDLNLPLGFDRIKLASNRVNYVIGKGKNPYRQEQHNGKAGNRRPSETRAKQEDIRRHKKLTERVSDLGKLSSERS